MFIVFEGIDGSGTSTQAKILAEKLNGLHTSEPTDREIGLLVRSALQKKWKCSPEALQMLFTADRIEHLDKVVLPALTEGKSVICDRYIASTLAFGALECDLAWLKKINQGLLKPDLVFYMQISAKGALERIAKRGEEKELFEKKEILERVLKNYERVLPKNAIILDATKSIKKLSEEIFEIAIQKKKEWQAPV